MTDQIETPSSPDDNEVHAIEHVETPSDDIPEIDESPQDELDGADEDATSNKPSKDDKKDGKDKFAKLKTWTRAYWARKKWTLPLTIFLVVVALLSVPVTRYLVLGTFVHSQTKIVVYDAKSNKPVSSADIIIGSTTGKTDLGGNLLLSPKLGSKTLLVSKKYYTSVSKPVVIGWPGKLTQRIMLTPTGRLVPINLTNTLTGKPIAGALVKSAGTETHTDKNGKATIVLPTTAATQKAKISLAGYNTVEMTIQVTDQAVAGNDFTLTPSGRLYFLSNQSGKIDVVKTNLDGSDRQTIFAGTGTEDAATTSLLASRDWKYLALLSKHNADSQSLYLINTSNDQVTNIDGGSTTVSFNLVGWADDIFVYQVNRSNITSWQSGAQALKSYDAASGKLYNIDQSQGEGTSVSDAASTSFSSIYLLKDEIVYAKNWSSNYSHGPLTGKNVSLLSAGSDGTDKKTIKDFPADDSSYYYQINLAAYEPGGLYVQVPNNDGTYNYYEYEDGKLSAKDDLTVDTFNKAYSTYLASPSGKQTFWSEVRDNKNTLFIGDDDAQGGKQIATLSDYTPYGWYTDNYLLVSKNGSELYVLAPDSASKAKKVTDYYKPQTTYRGYGGGYGGI